jgi:cytidylate kinase
MMHGHLLCIPAAHTASVMDLSPRDRISFDTTLDDAMARVRSLHGAAIALEHGRTPVCFDLRRSCHVHVHVLPVELSVNDLIDTGLVRTVPDVPSGEYVMCWTGAGIEPAVLAPTRLVPHLARSLVAVALGGAGTSTWLPLTAPESRLRAVRDETVMKLRVTRRPPVHPVEAPDVIWITGAAGTGKSTLARALAAELRTDVAEVGVLVRLAAVLGRNMAGDHCASMLWRRARMGRLDFHADSRLGLTARAPRVDGTAVEAELWTATPHSRVAELAASPAIDEVLQAVAQRFVANGTGILVGRRRGSLGGMRVIELHLRASEAVRLRRKAAQISRVTGEAAACDPPGLEDPTAASDAALVLDTTSLSPSQVLASARVLLQLHGLGVRPVPAAVAV